MAYILQNKRKLCGDCLCHGHCDPHSGKQKYNLNNHSPAKLFNFHPPEVAMRSTTLKGLAQAKIIKKSVILFWLLNMTI